MVIAICRPCPANPAFMKPDKRVAPASAGRAWPERPYWPLDLLTCLLAALVFGALALMAIEMTRGDGRIAMVWVPNAFAVAALLRWQIARKWALYLALWNGNLCANLLAGDTIVTALALSSANALEIFLATSLVARLVGPRPDMHEIRDLLWFVLLAGVIAPAASASFAITALGNIGEPLATGWLKWMVTDALGMILFAPSLLIFIDSIRDARWPSRRTILNWVMLTMIGTAVTLAVFLQTDYPLLFLIYPVVLCHAFRLGSLGTAFSIFNIGLIAIVSTLLGVGPINLANGSVEEGLVVLQAFLASAFVVGLPIAAILNRHHATLRELADRQAQLSLLADNMSDAVMRYDLSGICTYASASTEDVLGQPVGVFVGKQAAVDVHPDARDEITAVQDRLVSGQSDKERLTYRRVIDDKKGRPVFIEADCVLVRDDETGKPETIIVSCRDVSQRVRLEKKLVRARRHAENAAIAKSQFLANMSHEIRTPMNGVLGFVELLLQTGLPEGQRRHAELIQESGNSMMRLLNDILDISKIEAGQIAVSNEAIELDDVLGHCVTLHSANAAQKGIKLVHRCRENLPKNIVTDSLRLRQIILNLLGNAVKFTRSGQIALDAGVIGDNVVIAVEDSGIGIEQDRLEAIFQPFEQADNATSRQFGGTGLGLSISRHLAELLGGTLTAVSKPGKGSRFELRIPLILPDEDAMSDALNTVSVDPTKLIAGSRILLAEDHDINRILVTTMLERCGLDVVVAQDGRQAVAEIMSAHGKGEPFQLVLMDVQMPECDGYSATRTIRDLGLDAHELPIVALTANAFEDDRIAARDAGMQGHLAKPLRFDALVETLQKWLPTVSGTPAEPDAHAPLTEGQSGTPSLQAKWQARRSDALDAVANALRANLLEGEPAEILARTVHKLAGTAGMFGEDQLGERASQFECALKADTTVTERQQLAQKLLDAA